MRTAFRDLLRAPSSRRTNYCLVTLDIVALVPLFCFGQENLDEGYQRPSGHVLWIVPNFRTSPELQGFKPIASREKFRIAAQDTFDRGTIALAAAFAGESQFSTSNPSLGGAQAHAHYWITAYSDFAIGNYMRPKRSFLHSSIRIPAIFVGVPEVAGLVWDPSVQLLGDRGQLRRGGDLYGVHPGNRNASNAAEQLWTRVVIDMTVNIVEEFWPSRERNASRKSAAGAR